MEFHRRRKIEAAIDMTPMIDTLLQLFLVFLLTASFVASVASAVPVRLPRAHDEQPSPAQTIVVSLDAAGQVFVQQEPASRSELRTRLLAAWQPDTERRVILRADRSLAYEKVLDVLQAIQQAGATQVDLAFEVDRRP